MGMISSFSFVFLVTLTFELGRRFCTVYTLPAKFDRPTFSRSRSYCVDKHTDTVTNKQTPLKTSTALRYATPVGITDNTENFCRLVLDFWSGFGAQNASRSTAFFQTAHGSAATFSAAQLCFPLLSRALFTSDSRMIRVSATSPSAGRSQCRQQHYLTAE